MKINGSNGLPPARMNGNRPGGLYFSFHPSEFRGLPGRPAFKFVFCREGMVKLAVGPYDDKHRVISQAVFGRQISKYEGFAGTLAYEERDGMAYFTLSGGSAFYGKPNLGQLFLAANYISSLLKDPFTTSGSDSVVVKAPLG